MTPRIHHLNCGTLCPLAARFVSGSGSVFERGRMVCHCLLIETDRDGLVLVDTGLGTGDLRQPSRLGSTFTVVTSPTWDPREPAVAQVAALGFDPRDVRHVVVTHLDLDHAGGLGDFPHAQVHLHAREHAAASARASLRERGRYLPLQWAHGPRWVQYSEEGEDWHGLRGLRLLAGVGAEILLVPLFGHTRGHSGVAVRAGEGWLLHAGDAYFHHDEVAARPSCPAALRWFQSLVEIDGPARRANARRLQELNQRRAVTMFCAHDPVELAALQSSAPAHAPPARDEVSRVRA